MEETTTAPDPNEDPLWKDINLRTERVIQDNHGVRTRVPIDPRVIAIRDMVPTDEEVAANDTYGSRNREAAKLHIEGCVIDTQIDIWAWSPANAYGQRQGYGTETVDTCFPSDVRIVTPPVGVPLGD